MIFLLNKSRVVYEIAELARLRMARVLMVQPEDVRPVVHLSPEGRLNMEFQVNMEAAEGVTQDQVVEVIQATYDSCKAEASLRLATVEWTREQVQNGEVGIQKEA